LAVGLAAVAREQAATKEALQREQRRVLEAEARFQLARRAADEMIRIAEEELSDNPFQEGLRKQLLDTSLAYYQEFIELRGESPDAQAELSVTRDRVKGILADLKLLQDDRHTFLLRENEVLDDLQATPTQRAKIAEMIERLEGDRRGRPRGPREANPDQHRQRGLAIARENELELSGILNQTQIQRLPQIALQCQGPRALREPDVVNALKLTSEQKQQLRELEREGMMHARADFPQGPQSRNRSDPRMKLVLKQMLESLNAEQRLIWEKLTGPPYVGPMFFSGPPGSPGSPGSPGPRPGEPNREDRPPRRPPPRNE
jgi:hypothetical protein